MSSVRGGLKSKCRGPSYPPFSRMSTTQNAPRALPAPKRRSWSKRGPFWPLRSTWKSLPCHSAWASPWAKLRPGHLLVADLGVEADQLGVLELLDERQRVADGRQQDVAAGLVGLRLDGEAEVVALLEDVAAQDVEAPRRSGRARPGRPWRRRTPRPRGRPRRRTSARRARRPGRCCRSALRSAKRRTSRSLLVKRAVAEDRVREEVRGHHRYVEAGRVERVAHPAEQVLALGVGVGAERDHVVVVEGDARRRRARPACGSP